MNFERVVPSRGPVDIYRGINTAWPSSCSPPGFGHSRVVSNRARAKVRKWGVMVAPTCTRELAQGVVKADTAVETAVPGEGSSPLRPVRGSPCSLSRVLLLLSIPCAAIVSSKRFYNNVHRELRTALSPSSCPYLL